VHRWIARAGENAVNSPWRPCVTCALKALTLSPKSADTAPEDVVCLGALWADRGGAATHSDTERYGEVRRKLHSAVRMFAVSSGPRTSAPTTLSADLRSDRCWHNESTRGVQESITCIERGATVFLLDYYWTPPIYF
jgi:hypothetical protein